MFNSHAVVGMVRFATLAVMLFTLCGCGYTLRGKVVRGDVPGVELIHEIDSRLKGPGVGNIEVFIHRDPNTPNRRRVAADRTSTDGAFAMYMGEFGAGWMDEQWLVQATGPGVQKTEAVMKLPAKGSKWQILITVAPGTSAPRIEDSSDYMQDYERFK